MFFRASDWTLLLIFLTASLYSWAEVSQTTRFTLSVTIPEHTLAPNPEKVSFQTLSAQNHETPRRMNVQKEIRDRVPVLVASYVVD